MDKQTEFVLRAIEERDVRFVRMWFTDVLGFLKSVAVAPAELEGAFAEGMGFDGSAIEGFARVYESDMVAHPDPATFQVLPWRDASPATARRSAGGSGSNAIAPRLPAGARRTPIGTVTSTRRARISPRLVAMRTAPRRHAIRRTTVERKSLAPGPSSRACSHSTSRP